MSAAGEAKAEGRLSERGEAQDRRSRPGAMAAGEALRIRCPRIAPEAARRRAIASARLAFFRIAGKRKEGA